MKTIFLKTSIRFFLLRSFYLVFCLAAASFVSAQTYYSNFPSPTTGQYSATTATGGVLCAGVNAGFQNVVNVASADLSDYATLSGIVTAGVICNTPYSIRAKLNFPSGITQASAGYYAGFRAQFNNVLLATVLSSNLTINTYLNGAPQESRSGSNLVTLNVNVFTFDTPLNIAFKTSLPFDEVELVLNNGAVNAGLLLDYRFFYSFGSATIILPINLTSFTAAIEDKNVALNWNVATEINTSRYEIEKSDAQGKFTSIGSVAAKGTINGSASYTFTDRQVTAGENLYRLKMIDKDGSVTYTKAVLVKNQLALNWNVFPTFLSKGANVNVSFANTGMVKSEVRLINLQGQAVGTFATYNSKISIPTSNLTNGIYTLKLFQNGQSVASQKIIIQ